VFLILVAIATTGGLMFLLASLLIAANRKLYVPEDPRIDVVEGLLPAANCGACGVPGCRQFAEALVSGAAAPGQCTVSSDAGRARIARFLGVDVGAGEKRVARLACAGGFNVARNRARYEGIPTCGGAALVAGGGKSCSWGCLGLGDCDVACDFDAISMSAVGLPIVDEILCTACGDCVDACPKDLFSVHPISHRLWVACANPELGDDLLADCEVACTACGRCERDGPGLITIQAGLPVVDYGRHHATKVPIERCPTGAIVWLDPSGVAEKGPAATKIIRLGARPEAST